jgi:hypothetical protein
MKREITLGQLLGVAVTVIMAIAGGWISLSNKVATNESELKNLEIRFMDMQIETNKKYDKLDQKVDEMAGTLNDIKVLLERKQDRR